MPLSLTLCIEDSFSAVADFSVAMIFGEAESIRLEKIKNERRKRESLSGLIALKKALGKSDASDIVRDANGRPCFVGGGIDFSISHSGRLAAACVADDALARVGIDLERMDEKKSEFNRRIADRYFTESEREQIRLSSDAETFYRIWTAKEAVAKLDGRGLLEVISGREDISLFRADIRQFFVTCQGERYVLTIACSEIYELRVLCAEGITLSGEIL